MLDHVEKSNLNNCRPTSMSRPTRLERWIERTGRRPRGPAYVYLSFHKTATQFTERVLRSVCRYHRLRAATFDSRHRTVEAAVLSRTDFLLLTDYSSEMIDLAALDVRGVRVIRDPRDTLVSMYFSHRSSHALNHEEIAQNRQALADLDVSDGLDYLMRNASFFKRIVRELDVWLPEDHGYYETTFERLTRDPRAEFAAILEALGLPLEDADLEAILAENSFSALQDEWAEDHPGADTNHYRKGVAGEWRRYLIGDAKESFRARYGSLLVRLGYEATLDW